MKKKISVFLAFAMIMSVLTACNGNAGTTNENTTENSSESVTQSEPNEQQPDSVKLTDGYFKDESTGLLSFVRFNEDGTYYAKYFDGGALDAGTYKVTDENMEYSVDGGADEDMNTVEDNTKANALQTIILTSYSSGEEVRIAYTEDQLCDMSLAGMANHRTLIHDAKYAYDPSKDETPIELYTFYANNSIGSNFILNHDKTFNDLTGDAFASGEWKIAENGGYELTYSDGTAATLTIDASGKSAVLVKADGTSIDLKDDYKSTDDPAQSLVMSLRADDVQVGLPMSVNLRLDGYSDGSCKLIVEVAQIGAELEADSGTFTVSETMKPTFTFDKAGEIEGTPDYAGATADGIPFAVTYVGDTDVEFNGSLSPLSINSEVTGIYKPDAAGQETEPSVTTTLRLDDTQVGLPMSVGLRIDCYDDNSCKLIVEVAQLDTELEADKGTYEISETMKFTFHFDTAGDVTGEPDYGSATPSGVDVKAVYTGNTEVEFGGNLTPLTIDAELVGTYSVS